VDQAITFIVPTYNRSAYLTQCLDSIRHQMGPHDDVLVVDDGSSDGTPELLQAYAARHRSAVRVERLANGGKSRALNHALRCGTAPLVWIVDDDDVLLPLARRALTRLLVEHPQASFAYGRHDRFVDAPSQLPLQTPRIGTGYWAEVDSDHFLIATLEDMFAHQPGMLVRRALYDKAGPFDESLPRSIDYEMLIRLAEHGRGAATDEVVFLQRQHDGQRGPAASRLAESQRNATWAKQDRNIFAAIWNKLPLALYLPHRRIDTALDRRQALIQRGTIMARKDLWIQAIEDFHAAIASSDEPLSESERAIARRAFSSKYAEGEPLSPGEMQRGLAALAKAPPPGAELARTLARGFYWQLRSSSASLDHFRTAFDLTLAAHGHLGSS